MLSRQAQAGGALAREVLIERARDALFAAAHWQPASIGMPSVSGLKEAVRQVSLRR
jgi:hypothetical protein